MRRSQRPRRRRRLAAIAAVSALTGSLVAIPPAGATTLDQTGEWSPVLSWPLISIHAALTPEGDVLTFGSTLSGVQGGTFYAHWDRETDTHTTTRNRTGTDLFCALQAINPVLDAVQTVGGDNFGAGSAGAPGMTLYVDGVGPAAGPGMAFPRWYPTGNVLPSGDLFVHGGSLDGAAGVGITTPEIYSPDTGWRTLSGIDSADAYGDTENRWWYPRSWVAPDGDIFAISGSQMFEVDPTGLGTLTLLDPFPGTNIGATSTAVMYRPGLILQVGGGGFENGGSEPASADATIVDINGPTPVLTPAAPLSQGVHWATATVLPDGDVLVAGGAEGNNTLTNVDYTPEIWDPNTDTWTAMAPHVQARLYHSTAMLLPDATVLLAGGGAPGPQSNLNAEIFSPPYLFDGDTPASRPTIDTAPERVDYGESFDVTVSADVDRFTLVGASAVTHSFNMTQRFLELPSSGSGASRSVSAPASANDAPPGTYLLFALTADGTPSIAALVELDAPSDPPADGIIDLGGFEAGPSAAPGGIVDHPGRGWFGPWFVDEDVSRDDAGHHGGGPTGHHLNLQDDGSVRRYVTGLVEGADYELSIQSARHKDAPAGTVSASVEIDGVTHAWSATNPSDGPFEAVAVPFTASADVIEVTFTGTASPTATDGVVIDDPVIAATGTVSALPGAVLAHPEGHTGTTTFSLPVTLDRPSGRAVTLDWHTLALGPGPGIAQPGLDVVDASGTLTFAPGVTVQPVPVEVIGDSVAEPPLLWGEWGVIGFDNPSANTVIDTSGFFGLGLYVIADDD